MQPLLLEKLVVEARPGLFNALYMNLYLAR